MTNNDDAVFAKSAYMTNGGSFYPGQDGLTKREYFAAMAMQAILSIPSFQTKKETATAAVQMADALILELNKEQDNVNT